MTVIVPRRSDGGPRDRLWEFCRPRWERFGPVVEGHHDDGPFNRSKAINDAAKQVADDVLLIVDGDVICDPEQVQAAIDRARDTGRLTFAYTEYRGLDRAMTERVLAGYHGPWKHGVRTRMTSHVSSVLAVPRALWDLVGGFDERCEGWGCDDTIFAHACRVLGGGCERIDGPVWHLWHPTGATFGTPGYRASAALAARYFAAVTPAEVARIVAERTLDGVCLVVVTDGRRDCIGESLPSAHENLKGLPIIRTVICDDSGDVDYQAWLRWRFPDCELVASSKRSGFANATRRAWDVALGSGQPWVFWLEDDFVFQRPVDLSAVAQVLTEHPELTQMVIRRQAWFPHEVKAGGIIDADPDNHRDESDGTHEWVSHGLGHWTNPHLVSRQFLAEHEWPKGNSSEARFARSLKGRRSAYWGSRTDEPWVLHMGERHGTGY